MTPAADGLPTVGQTARTLGARTSGPTVDITADGAGNVHPGTGGMSVTADDPTGLPSHRRPPECDGGTGKDPVFRIRATALGPDLSFRPEPGRTDGHGFVEPARSMSIGAYQAALAATRGRWELVVF